LEGIIILTDGGGVALQDIKAHEKLIIKAVQRWQRNKQTEQLHKIEIPEKKKGQHKHCNLI
jgi:hypothetical protein